MSEDNSFSWFVMSLNWFAMWAFMMTFFIWQQVPVRWYEVFFTTLILLGCCGITFGHGQQEYNYAHRR